MKKSEFMNIVLNYSIENEELYTEKRVQLYVCNSIRAVRTDLIKLNGEASPEIYKLAYEIIKDISFWLDGRSTVSGWLRRNPNTPDSFHDCDRIGPNDSTRISEMNHYRILWIKNIIEYYQSIGD